MQGPPPRRELNREDIQNTYMALESAYEECLCRELELRRINIVELKTVEAIAPIHEAQILTYLKMRYVRLGLIINFNARLLVEGIRRLVNG